MEIRTISGKIRECIICQLPSGNFYVLIAYDVKYFKVADNSYRIVPKQTGSSVNVSSIHISYQEQHFIFATVLFLIIKTRCVFSQHNNKIDSLNNNG